MNKFKFAIGTDDDINIRNGHLGSSKQFKIYEIGNHKCNLIEIRENNSPEEDEVHGATKKIEAIIDILNDVDIIIGRKMSPSFKKIVTTYPQLPVICSDNNIDTIIKKIHTEKDNLYTNIKERKNGNLNDKIPII